MNNLQKTIKVLEFLEFGMELEVNGHRLCLGEDEKENDRLSVVMSHQIGKEKQPDKLLEFEITINNLIDMMDNVSEEDIIIWGANKVLTEINRKKR